MKARYLFALAALGSVATSANAANLVTNGSFETGDFTGWTVDAVPGGGTEPVVIPYGNPVPYPNGAFGEAIPPSNVISLSPDPVGSYTAYFSSDTANPHSLTQTVNLVGGITYDIGFDYYAPLNGYDNPNDATLQFLVNGVQVGDTLTVGSGTGIDPETWYNFNTQFVSGPGGPQDYTFEFRGLGVTAADFAIDRVYASAAVPEPGTWLLMLLGFGLVGGAMRASKKRETGPRVRYAF